MAAVVDMVRPTSAHTFRDYVSQHLVPFVQSQVTRVDAVWDTYPEDNLKTLTHQHRGLGPRTRIGDGNTRIPKQDWNTGFLKNTDNKRELFPFLSTQLVKQDLGGRLLLSTYLQTVISCTGNCKCSGAGVRCTGLCKCEGGCVNNEET